MPRYIGHNGPSEQQAGTTLPGLNHILPLVQRQCELTPWLGVLTLAVTVGFA